MCTNKSTSDNECSIDINDCVFSQRCFMTGEYCSKQRSIQRERHQLHNGERLYENTDPDKPQVNAFVIMNFSSMSDVIYKWRIKPFVEGLKNYLYFDRTNEKSPKLCCSSEPNPILKRPYEEAVERVNVIRADTNPSSNFVICNRICQQMQIADIVVVDVSDENANVFYELGLAVALRKMILPICYSESYFKEVLPEKLAKEMEKYDQDLRHHIDCFPWRRKLFEHFGILFRNAETNEAPKWKTEYKCFEKTTKQIYGFSDNRWVTFPYYEKFSSEGSDMETVGEKIYNRLQSTFNDFKYEYNTLIVYSMDRFLNPQQAGSCIINYHKNIVNRFANEKCFCGDRVGVLIQTNAISEDTKDAEYRRKVPYKIGDIILTGLNQATFQTNMETIKAGDSTKASASDSEETKMFKKNLERFAKEYMGNRGLPIYPEIPIHVQQLKHGIQSGALDETGDFSFFRVMLQTLKYCNEIVVDISNNIVQMLFWLGAAHGAGIPAITVKYVPSADELKEQIEEARKKSSEPLRKERNIFDVSGLWTAVLYSNRTDLFYKQLVDVQRGIETGAKRLIPEIEGYENDIIKVFLTKPEDICQENPLVKAKMDREKKYLESYYRIQLWRHMLLYNSFMIYAPLTHDEDDNQEFVSLWDVKGLARISNYLSKRKTIGNYEITAINQNTKAKEGEEEITDGRNYLCLGKSGPHSKQSLVEYIGGLAKMPNEDLIFSYDDIKDEDGTHQECRYRRYRGFTKQGMHYCSQVPVSYCFKKCPKSYEEPNTFIEIINSVDSLKEKRCSLSPISTPESDTKQIEHKELGQLVLWRDEKNGHNVFRVAVSGASGPATYAVSAVLVDLEQKKDIFGENNEKAFYLLSNIQSEVRKKLVEKYKESLDEELRKKLTDEMQKELEKQSLDDSDNVRIKKYIKRVLDSVEIYLNSTLYKFVFPFLSTEDIDTITNGLRAYINGMQALEISPFSLNFKLTNQFIRRDDQSEMPMTSEVVLKAELIAVDVLKEALESLFCIEVMFVVTVGTEDKSSSNKNYEEKRRVTDITIYEVGGKKLTVLIRKN